MPFPHRLAATLVAVVATLLVPVLAAAPSQAGTASRVQQRLVDLGCRPGPAGGSGGARTVAALVRFQSANRLPQSGRATTATRSRLATATPTRCDRRPVPARSGRGRRVVVSQQQNYLWLVGAHGRVLAQEPMVDNPRILRPGQYRAGSQCGRAARIAANSDYTGRYRLARFVRFAPCGVGFHQIPTGRSGAQLHRDYLLGTDLRTSHGCIRLSREMSVRVWDFVTIGTTVVVVH
ncbi:MAG: peptidoglycan-binding protein [Nocardioidaceae bacterium]